MNLYRVSTQVQLTLFSDVKDLWFPESRKHSLGSLFSKNFRRLQNHDIICEMISFEIVDFYSVLGIVREIILEIEYHAHG